MDKYCPRCDKNKETIEFGKNVRRHDGLQSYCKVCVSEYNKEKGYDTSERKRKHHSDNKEKANKLSREYYWKNREACLENKKRYHEENREKILLKMRKWGKDNPDKKNANNNKRRAKKLNATPKWADTWKIDQYYVMARKLTESTDIKFVVDHIIPLQGKLVSGLHVENNLQVITEHENAVKHNKFEPTNQGT